MRDERKLIKRLQRGDRGAFEEFLDSYGGQVHRLVRRYVANPADAEDITQEIFLDIYRSIGSFRGEAALTTWIYRIAVNRCLRHCQRKRPDNAVYDEQTLPADWKSDPAQTAANRELSEEIQCALTKLSPLHQDVVILCEVQGLTYQECASVLEIPVGTVKSRLSNAFRRLRENLSGYVFGGEAGVPAPQAVMESTP